MAKFIYEFEGAGGRNLKLYDTKVAICVVRKEKSPYIEELLLDHENCTVFKSIVSDSLSGIAYK